MGDPFSWRKDYNEEGPHKSLDNKTPKEYISAWMKSSALSSLLLRREGTKGSGAYAA